MRRHLRMMFLVGLLCALVSPQDLHVTGVTVHTGSGTIAVDPPAKGPPARDEPATTRGWPSAVAVQDGRLLGPGVAPPLRANVIELRSGHLYPGLMDAHGHLLGLGHKLQELDLTGIRSYEDLIRQARARARTQPKGSWVIGRGWDQNLWSDPVFPVHTALSVALPDHPVFLTRIDGHAALVNMRAMQIAQLTKDTTDPAGGEILRAADGSPTGVLIDTATALVASHLPVRSATEIRAALLAAHEACVAVGLTCVHDAGMDPATLAVLRRLHTEGRWLLRTYVMLPATALAEIRKGPWQTPDQRIIVRSVKAYADGALGSRGAALLDPYSDRPSHRGLMLTPAVGIERLAQLCADHGMQCCVHAIGDRANRIVLDAFAKTRFDSTRGPADLRHARFRIEHAQVVAPTDFDRFAKLGVVPCMQPTHLTSDMPWAQRRLGPERTRGAYAWRSFLARGVKIAFGSDFPVESHDPRLGLFAAVSTRASVAGEPLRPEQRLSRAEALAGFGRDAAHAAFLERDLGAIEAGRLADFVVFDRDLATCPEAELLEAKVLLCVIGGRVAYRSKP